MYVYAFIYPYTWFQSKGLYIVFPVDVISSHPETMFKRNVSEYLVIYSPLEKKPIGMNEEILVKLFYN